ncbi:hypothetical protein [Xenorhabdus bovienii]|uniref:Uncharacterized protein n=1 Tax=Xenorhabdus bovienii str. Intermedium TaxID=1379677 RepID=A0A077QL04_XENBV|nr:hypothetical protein [Xenorhabdus bovienii]MDE1484289.1 hypothetical protein [Xenorhabdus bovienii]MDE9463315.1 hypothetical protein [Xenorhabdus bovienii]CDH33893.1 exported hypothetical protein [Xenorhabdus bovienii str. Intermedium]
MRFKFALIVLFAGIGNTFADTGSTNEAYRTKILEERSKLISCATEYLEKEAINTKKGAVQISSETVEICDKHFEAVEDANLAAFKHIYSEPEYAEVIEWQRAVREGNIWKSKRIYLEEGAIAVIKIRKQQLKQNK